MMSPIVGWSLAVLGIAAGYVGWGWPGVVLGVTVLVFWLLLQFSRSLRVLKLAAGNPVGHVDSAVMLHSKLKTGMTLSQVLPLTRSLGTRLSDTPERWGWVDPLSRRSRSRRCSAARSGSCASCRRAASGRRGRTTSPCPRRAPGRSCASCPRRCWMRSNS